MNWALFPLLLQAVYVASAAPPLLRLVRSKRSDQHAVSNQFLSLGAHVAMVAWAWAYASQLAIAASAAISIATTGATLGTILYYRHFPGGRPPSARSAPSRAPARVYPTRPSDGMRLVLG